MAYPMVAVVAALAGALLFLLVAGVVMYETLYAGRLLWGVSLMGVDLAGYRPEEARAELVYRFQVYARQPVVLRTSTQQWKATPEELGLRFNVDQSVDAAYRVGRVGGSLERLLTQWRAARGRLNAEELSLSVDDAALSAYLEKLEPGIDRAMRDAALVVQPDFQVRITPSSPGLKLEHKDTKAAIKAALLKFSTEPIELVVLEGSPAILEATLQETKARAERSIAAPLVLQSPDRAWTIDRQTLAAMLTFPKSSSGKAGLDARLDRGKLESMLAEVARQVDRPPVDARFHLTGNKVQVLRESRDGLHMDVAAAVEAIERQAASEDRLVALPLVLARPKVASADGHLFLPPQVIEEAKTDYRGGARERMDNIELAAKKLHGTVVPPGDVFSFNRELGATTLAAGFKWGWGITSSGDEFATVPSVAGGICQVSTTLFQAVFWAGYAIEERYPHVYWITRYGQLPKGLKGLDATMDQIFDSKGNLAYQVDVKFVNNGDSPVLIQAYADGQFLTFALFGKKPDWKVEISQPKIEDVVKADAEEVIEEDPNALEGKRIQIEVAQDGFKSTITRKVTSPGQEPRTLNLVSTYKPSRNMFLVGTKKSPTPMASPTPGPGTPVPATPTPSPGTPVPATPTPGPGLRTATPTPRPPVSTPQPKPGSPAPPTPSPKPGG